MSIQDLYRRQSDIDFEPWYQRKHIWEAKRDSLLIDTILKNWDIPKIYLRVTGTGKYEVIDGHQRLLAIFNFVKADGYRLVGDQVSHRGMAFSDLEEELRKEILRYKMQIVFVERAKEEEIAEMFQRLQLGKRLESGEILNAMSGDMSEFVKKLANNPFFPDKTYLSAARFSYLQTTAQIVHLELKGLTTAKLPNLRKMYFENKKFRKNWTLTQQVPSIIQQMDELVPTRSELLSNRAIVVSFYDFVSSLGKMGFSVADHKRDVSNAFFEFLKELRMQVQMGIDATDRQLIEFQLNVIQGADSGSRIRKRHEIILERMSKKLRIPKT